MQLQMRPTAVQNAFGIKVIEPGISMGSRDGSYVQELCPRNCFRLLHRTVSTYGHELPINLVVEGKLVQIGKTLRLMVTADCSIWSIAQFENPGQVKFLTENHAALAITAMIKCEDKITGILIIPPEGLVGFDKP